MKIKIAILEKDENYLKRISATFNSKYADKVEVHSFTNQDLAIAELGKSKIDVFIASELFEIDTDKLPKHCGFAYFTDSVDVESLRGQPAIGKFQRADSLYKQMLSIYSENSEIVGGIKHNGSQAEIIIFASPCGGTGTSSLAAASAIRYASQGKKVFYLNLETFGTSDVYFNGDGQFDMSDIIFSLKSHKVNLSAKLESCVKISHEGVSFYSTSKLALDLKELKEDEIIRLLRELKINGAYSHIIVDTDFSIARECMKEYELASALVWVSDGSLVANSKIARAYAALSVIEGGLDTSLTNRICLIYNQFSNKIGQKVSGADIRELGGAPRFDHANSNEVVARLSQFGILDAIV